MHLRCSKGTYVRSIAEDLGEALGCGAHVSALRRTAAGPFELSSAISLATLEAVEVSEAGGFYIRQGQPVLVPNSPCSGMVRMGLETGEFLGIGEILDDGRVAPRRLIAESWQ